MQWGLHSTGGERAELICGWCPHKVPERLPREAGWERRLRFHSAERCTSYGAFLPREFRAVAGSGRVLFAAGSARLAEPPPWRTALLRRQARWGCESRHPKGSPSAWLTVLLPCFTVPSCFAVSGGLLSFWPAHSASKIARGSSVRVGWA